MNEGGISGGGDEPPFVVGASADDEVAHHPERAVPGARSLSARLVMVVVALGAALVVALYLIPASVPSMNEDIDAESTNTENTESTAILREPNVAVVAIDGARSPAFDPDLYVAVEVEAMSSIVSDELVVSRLAVNEPTSSSERDWLLAAILVTAMIVTGLIGGGRLLLMRGRGRVGTRQR